MTEFKLIYFEGCPNYQPAVDLLNDCGIHFKSIRQDDLNESDPLNNYSSPTLLADSKVIFGARVTGGACSMSLPSKVDLMNKIEIELSKY